jgi:cytochrome b561
VLVLLTTLSRWVFVSVRGWTVSWFFVARLPMLTQGNRGLVKVLDGWRQNFLWALLMLAGLHVAAAFIHLFYYRDGRCAADITWSHCH